VTYVKICQLWSFYDVYLKYFYERNPQVASLDYRSQLRCLLKDYAAWPAAMSEQLAETGHQVEFIIVNAKPLQQAWAREQNIPFSDDWQYRLPELQIESFKPDILWISSMFGYYGEFLRRVRKHCSLVFSWIACAFPDSLDLDPVDCVITSHQNLLEAFKLRGKASEKLLPSFNPAILDAIGTPEKRDIEASFIGGVSEFHRKRLAILSKLIGRTNILLWGYGYDSPPPVGGVRSFLRRLRYDQFISKCSGRLRDDAWGLDLYRVLSRSRMTIDVHVDIANGVAGNMRLFEATGCGALLFTESAVNLSDMFEPGREVIVYRDASDLIDKMQYYAKHPDECRAIGMAGQQRTLSEHNTARRCGQLLDIFNRY